jgi:hypothetical protein
MHGSPQGESQQVPLQQWPEAQMLSLVQAGPPNEMWHWPSGWQ